MLAAVRVTFLPPGSGPVDLELTVGVPLGSLRTGIAAVTGCPDAAHAPLAVGSRVLDDAHLAGTFPLVAGARLSLGPVRSDDDGVLAAVRAPRRLAVREGPEAGLLWPVPERLAVGREERTSDALVLADPRVSQRHLELRTALGRVWVRDLGSANGSRLSPAWAGHRLTLPLPRSWTLWRTGDLVLLGETVLELRAADAPSARPGGHRLALAATALAPALGSLALVAGTGNPAMLALGLAGAPLAALAHRLAPEREEDASPEQRPGELAPVRAVDLAQRSARGVLSGEPPAPDGTLARLAPTGTLAVLGPRAREVAATLVLAAAPGRVEVRGAHERWTWTSWVEGEGPEVVVVDGAEASPDERVVVLVDPPHVPSWCTAVLEATRWSGPDGETACEVEPGGAAWAERHARLLAGARCVAALGASGVPESVTLGALGLTEVEVEERWRTADDGLRAVLGAGAAGHAVEVDLAREGPHVLVAGTTGSGKSEALRALVASLALRYPPTALAFALVDFKGGAGFGSLARLPHVVGAVTDLDAHEAARAMSGIAAELRARKAALARVGASDLRDWPPGAAEPHPGRLVVVVDEFRALAEELPELMGALERLATQGRSLGVHLVLATQRPSGVVSAELRANVALRLALRVTDPGDSSDVVEVPDAAQIPPSLPGRALLKRGPGGVETLQVALVGGSAPPVRLAGHAPEPSGTDPDERLLTAVSTAAARWAPGAPRPAAPWLPALPSRLEPSELTAGPDRLPFALADEPETQSRSVATWDPAAGHLLAIGGTASGRTTLLSTLGAAALARGWAVHAIGLPDGALAREHPGTGTVCPLDDPRRLARLVTLLAQGPARTVLLVDDVESAWHALETVARGEGATRLLELLRARHVGVAMTATGPGGPWSGLVGDRVILPLADQTAEELAGVPRTLSGARRGPGRAVWLPARAEPLVCQVAMPGAHPPHVEPAVPPVRLAPLPVEAYRPAEVASRRRLVLGLGGDSGRPLGLDAGAGGLVVGPPGSGRSTALAHLVLSARRLALDLVTVARDGPVLVAADGAAHGFEREALLEALAQGPDAVVVDDLDALARLEPEVAEQIDELVDDGLALFASLTTTAALSAFRGAVATLRARRHGLVLGASTAGSDEVLGSPLAWHLDPPHAARPGRGVLQRGGRLAAIQVFAPPG